MKPYVRYTIRVTVWFGALLAIVLVPRNETEIHKRRCEAAWSRLEGKSISERLKGTYYQLTKTLPSDDSSADDWDQFLTSRQALLELGYLVETEIELSNGPAGRIYDAFHRDNLRSPFVSLVAQPHNIAEVTAPKSEFAMVSNLVMRIDEREK